MRTRTLIKRLPFLPLADAYCCEAGGRIFYPTPYSNNNNNDNSTNDERNDIIQPIIFNSTTNNEDYENNSFLQEERKEPFVLVEDMEWRTRMELGARAGVDRNDTDVSLSKPILVESRLQRLWGYAETLKDSGIVLDTDGYTTCFRINRKQQSNPLLFDNLLIQLQRQQQQQQNQQQTHNIQDTDESTTDTTTNITLPPFPFEYLATSTNLGCIDVYPVTSGKKNW
jgi:hypothetical protein